MDESPTDGTRRPDAWNKVDARMARFSGVVGEIADPLTWGLDLEEEALTGQDDAKDPTNERFLRAYRTFAGESMEVETLRKRADVDQVEDVVRAAASGALAAPLHADIASPVEPVVSDSSDSSDASPDDTPAGTVGQPSGGEAGVPDFADAYQDYRSAMRAIVAEVDEVPLSEGTFIVDGSLAACTRLTVRGVTAVYVTTAERALVVTGPEDLVDRIDVVTRPIRTMLQGEADDRA
jgi:hypothetical protein